MNNTISAVEAQEFIIRLLTALSRSVIISIMDKAFQMIKPDNTDEKEFLNLCIRLSSERKEDPQCYNTLDSVCKAILIRQANCQSVTKKEYRIALGLKSDMQRNRIENGMASLTMDNITNICRNFQSKVSRRFWENRLLYLYPDISTVGRDDGPELRCLNILYKAFTPEQWKTAVSDLNELDRLRIDSYFNPSSENIQENRFGNIPDQLYEVINARASQLHMIVPDIAELEIGISANTWYTWRKLWIRAEADGFKSGIPATRLKRLHIILLAVLFGLDYSESIWFMALAGYRFQQEEPDKTVIQYLIQKNISLHDMKNYLQEGIYNGKW